MSKFFFSCVTVFAISIQLIHAQKFGHVNSADIIQAHPGVAPANAQLEAYQKSLSDPFDLKAKDFEARYHAFVDEANSGSMSQLAAQKKQQELQTEQDSLNTEDQQIKFKVMQKREMLLQPILTEVDSVIQLIGREGHYTMIFDTSVSGALLFAEDGNDLTEEVKTRLKK